MAKRILVLVMTLALVLSFAGCSSAESQQSSTDTEVIIKQESIIQGGESSMTSSDNQSTNDTTSTPSVDAPVSSEEQPSSNPSSSSSEVSSAVSTPSQVEDDTIDIDYEWKSHPEDYKLIAFTFDDGPGGLMQKYVEYFAAFEGSGTFFVNGTKIKGDYEYGLMQNAINYGWNIGNHGDNHLVATTGGGSGAEVSYEQLRADIMNLTNKLESNLKFRDGSPYDVSLYRPPNIKPTANTFKICGEENLSVIWLSHDALDWGTNTKKDSYDVLKNGVGKWKDGDIILCHETSQNTYDILQEVLPDYFRAGYRFCSITELMEMRGITREQIAGELKEVDGNRGMVTNILDAAAAGKK